MIDEIKQYIEDRLYLLKLETIEVAARLIALVSKVFLVLTLAAFAIMMFSIAAALAIGVYYDNYVTGFIIVASLYLLIVISILIFKKSLLEEPITNTIIKISFKQKKNNTDEH